MRPVLIEEVVAAVQEARNATFARNYVIQAGAALAAEVHQEYLVTQNDAILRMDALIDQYTGLSDAPLEKR